MQEGQRAFSTFRVLNGDSNILERDQLFRNMAQLYSYVSDRCDDEQVAQYDEVLCQLAELVEGKELAGRAPEHDLDGGVGREVAGAEKAGEPRLIKQGLGRREGRFPAPVVLGARTLRWREDVIAAFVAARQATR